MNRPDAILDADCPSFAGSIQDIASGIAIVLFVAGMVMFACGAI